MRSLINNFKKRREKKRRESIISKALNTGEDRESLARAMVEFIRNKMNNEISIGRRVMMSEETTKKKRKIYSRVFTTRS